MMRPDQVILVFQLSSEYLTLNEALQLLCLNRYFKEYLPNSLYKRIVVQNALGIFSNGEDKDPQGTSQLLDLLGFSEQGFDTLYYSIKYAENLVKNPFGGEGFDYWKRSDGGDGWIINRWGTYKNKPTVFVSSYSWCKLTQNIPLPGFSNRFLYAKTMIARRYDCESEGQLRIRFDNGTLHSTEVVKCPYDPRDRENIKYGWKALVIKCTVPEEATSVDLILRGKDRSFWNGHYGARFGMTSLRVFQVLS